MSLWNSLIKLIRRPVTRRGDRPRGPGRGGPRSWRPWVEVLEDRNLLSTITPTTFADGVLGNGSLRDAVLHFNADAGTGDDIILLEAGTYALTIHNTGGHHETAGLEGDLNLTQTSHRWIIQGAGDAAVVLPADYSFTADDQGTHTFTGGFTLITPGAWTLTVAALANGLSQDVTLTVDP